MKLPAHSLSSLPRVDGEFSAFPEKLGRLRDHVAQQQYPAHRELRAIVDDGFEVGIRERDVLTKEAANQLPQTVKLLLRVLVQMPR